MAQLTLKQTIQMAQKDPVFAKKLAQDMSTGVFDDVARSEGVDISQQAENSTTSEVTRDSSTDWEVYYNYVPLPGFVGEDSVELQISKTIFDDSGSPVNSTESLLIMFNVTDGR